MANFLKAWGSLLFGSKAPEEVPEASPSGRRQAKGAVLLIDDDDDFLQVTANVLRSAGYAVLTSNTGTKGLNMIQYAPGDLRVVLLDYAMPQLDGEQTLMHLRRLRPSLRVVGLTGVPMDELPSGYREQLDSLLCKPLRREELLASLDKVFRTAIPSRAAPAHA